MLLSRSKPLKGCLLCNEGVSSLRRGGLGTSFFVSKVGVQGVFVGL